MSEKILVFDSTLRDGAQAEGISFSVEDKIRVVETLDKIGIDYIEAGNPGSNPKDIEFFNRIKGIQLKHAKLVAFGSTRRGGIAVEDDANLKAILETETPGVAIFGKSWTFHITDIIK
ncbi:MAG: citramalate synthase, partial [Acetobacterium sp.]|nr:citramalate synthase [Acetobacterium sp.]